MNIKKRIGKLFVIGYMGDCPDDDFLDFVEEWGIGGIIIFARNLKEPEKLFGYIEKIQKAAGHRLFTSIDQEGGLVLRILDGGSLFPSAMALASTGSAELTKKTFAAIGNEMRSFGLNWNLAPVLDINHPDNPGIGARAFGETPESVSRYGAAAIEGLNSSGVLACAKHFPGKGHAKVDSHLTLPIIPYSAEHIDNFELVPFKAAINKGVGAIMTSHVFFPAFEKSENLPATLSRSVLHDLLREKLKFDGLIITDDLEMGAITEAFGVCEATQMAFDAGADQLLICHSLDKQREAAENLLKHVQSSKQAEARLTESLKRIDKAREKIVQFEEKKNVNWVLEHEKLISEVYQKSIKFLRLENDFLPIDKTKKMIFVCPEISSLVQVEEEHQIGSFSQEITNSYPSAKILQYHPKGDLLEIIGDIDVNEYNKQNSEILFFTYNAHILDNQVTIANKLLQLFPQMLLIALRNPYDLACFPKARNLCATFGFRSPAIKALFKVLNGEEKALLSPWPVDL